MKTLLRSLATVAVVLPLAFGASRAQAGDDVVDTAVKAGSFSTLVTAIKAAGLVDTLKGKGPKGTVEDLLKPENKGKLTTILTYHVASGEVMSKDIAGKSMKTKSVEGSPISINATKGVMVEGAKVIKADVVASNGVIHVIDTVIMPPALRD